MGRTPARAVIAAFIVGVMCGAATLAPLAAQRMQDLQVQYTLLVRDLMRYRARLERLQQEQATPAPLVVRTAELDLLWHDEAVRLDLQEQLTPLLDGLEGRPVAGIDPYLVHSVFDGRLVELDHGRYRLTVKYFILGEHIRVVLGVAAVGDGNSGPGPGL
ncbi:MAG TPA: hypothetical protein VK008_02520 [Sphingobacteriaceae bacterium]|nr:hypothetical protein [Sphingobacteriaceae bacterium]